ncbi:MAG: CRISPR-associated endonuclease Cas3'', partial [Hyphomicrobium sp.]
MWPGGYECEKHDIGVKLQIFAHSVTDAPESEWEALSEHLSDVGSRCSVLCAKFDAPDWGLAAGLLHDVGKNSAEFQKRLRGSTAKVDHATAGARIACEHFGLWGRLLAYAIGGHHAGLANWIGEAAAGAPSPLERRIDPAYCVPPVTGWQVHCLEVPRLLSPFQPTSRSDTKPVAALNREGPSLALFTRMVFSALVDADRLATEEFYRKARVEREPPRGAWPEISALKVRTDAHMADLAERATTTAVEAGQRLVLAERASVLEAARRAAAGPLGLYSLTVPTGGGKTLASLTFALDHAVTHGLDRVIYVIPFTSIIEQTAHVFRDALGAGLQDCVLEHHSAFREDEALGRLEHAAGGESALQAGERLRFATENWDAPIVVTTAVQFFESLHSNRPSRCRKLHNIARSVVVLDEAQMLPLKLLRPTVAVIEELALKYKTSVVLCTATQPAITAEGRNGLGGLKGGLGEVREIVTNPEQLYNSMSRVTVAPCRKLTQESLAACLCELSQVLCIVGTRPQARDLYKLLIGRDPLTPTFHLSALMCAAHRTKRLEEIRAALNAGGCRVVATTVIEAGVDIDFPAVWRQMAGLDSIAQAAGRCNREGKRARSDAIVQPFEVEGWNTIRELRANEAAARETMRNLASGEDPLCPSAIGRYFDRLYAGKTEGRSDGLDASGIMAALNTGHLQAQLPFADVAAAYRMIESVMEPVIVPWDARASDAIKQLMDPDLPPESSRKNARGLQPYIVNVPREA